MQNLAESTVKDLRRNAYSDFIRAEINAGRIPYPPAYSAFYAGAESGARHVVATLTALGLIHRTGPNEYVLTTPAGALPVSGSELGLVEAE